MTQPKTKFRSLEEIRRYLTEMQNQLRLDEQIIDTTNKQLARIAATQVKSAIEFLDISGGGQRKLKKTLNVDFPVVKVPDAKTLDKNYKMAERLSEQYKYVVNLENEVRMNFQGTNHSSIDATLGSIRKLKADIERNLKSLFFALAKVAEGHAPKQYKDFVASLAEELTNNTHIQCEDAKTITYAALNPKGGLVFAGYIILINAVSDEDKIAPTLYVAIKWTVGAGVEVFVEHDFVAPNMLTGGESVANVQQAAKAIANQLSLEGFSSQIGNLPVSMQIKEPVGGLRRDLFTAAPFIKSISADNDALVFFLKPKVSKQQVEDIKHQLFIEVKSMLKKKRGTSVKMRTDPGKLTFTFVGLDSSDGLHPVDLDWLGDHYKLSDSQLRKIINVINSPADEPEVTVPVTVKTRPGKQTPQGPLWHPPGSPFSRSE